VLSRHRERHRTDRIGWLRAAVLGANDGIVSTASLLIGIAAANAAGDALLLAGVAALVAGAMSMAAGEYVSVCSQADAEAAELAVERRELETDVAGEQRELTAIYAARGVEMALAAEVARQLMAHDAIGAHARDELGITETFGARPVQAALASAASFATGAAMPLAAALLVPTHPLPAIAGSSLLLLVVLGGVAARAGGAPIVPAALRVLFWGALAMAITAGAGAWFGAAA
jgi:VIT1/CCC1 family predicted Fe2+/Mn2+ transporter